MISKECLPDVQCESPNIFIPIQQVGVENVEVPFKLESKYGGFHQMTGDREMSPCAHPAAKG